MKLTTHVHVVPSSRMCGAIPPFPNTLPRRGAQLKKKHRDYFTYTLSSEYGVLFPCALTGHHTIKAYWGVEG